LTNTNDPTLRWHAHASNNVATVFVQLNKDGLPIARVSQNERSSGYQSLKLSSAGLPRLHAGATYAWQIGMVLKDGRIVTTSATIAYLPLADQAALAKCTDSVCRAAVLADKGYWYDALDALMPDSRPPADDPNAIRLWRRLMDDIGLEGLP
jgi:hypothetical protein